MTKTTLQHDFMDNTVNESSDEMTDLEDAPSGVDGRVNTFQTAQVDDVQGSNDIGSDGFRLVVFAPVNVGTSRDTRGHEHMSGFDAVEFRFHIGTVFNADFGVVDFNAVLLAHFVHFTADPSCLSTVNEDFLDVFDFHGD